MQTKEEALDRLAKSKFRSSFHLTAAEKAYCAEKGEAVLCRHAADFVRQKLAPAHPVNGGAVLNPALADTLRPETVKSLIVISEN